MHGGEKIQTFVHAQVLGQLFFLLGRFDVGAGIHFQKTPFDRQILEHRLDGGQLAGACLLSVASLGTGVHQKIVYIGGADFLDKLQIHAADICLRHIFRCGLLATADQEQIPEKGAQINEIFIHRLDGATLDVQFVRREFTENGRENRQILGGIHRLTPFMVRFCIHYNTALSPVQGAILSLACILFVNFVANCL